MRSSLIVTFLSFCFCATAAAQEILQKLNIEPRSITVSGISSGAYMSTQMQVAFSSLIAGAGSIAGGPYWCAEGESVKAAKCMSEPVTIDIQKQIGETNRLFANGEIDDPAQLDGKKFFVFASAGDRTVHQGNSEKLIEYLRHYAGSAPINYVQSTEAGHGVPTLDYGLPCGGEGPPYLLKCNYDAAGDILRTFYGSLRPRGKALPAHLRAFSQKPFAARGTPLFPTAWVYVPENCAKGRACKLHVAFHGCKMNPEFVQNQFAVHGGYNEWAETNDIVVLYPQSAKVVRKNAYACWDWFGFTGKNYATKNGPQMNAVRAMIRAVSGL